MQPLQVHNGSWIADTLQFLCLPYSRHVIIFVLRLQRYYEAVPNSGMADKKKETLFPNLSCIKDKINPQANEGHSRLHQDNEYLAALTRCAYNSISH